MQSREKYIEDEKLNIDKTIKTSFQFTNSENKKIVIPKRNKRITIEVNKNLDLKTIFNSGKVKFDFPIRNFKTNKRGE